MGLRMTAYDATAVKDGSGDVRWMYVFDEHESRIYSVRNGLQRFENIELDADGLIDLDEAERQIKTAIDRLIIKHY